MPIHDWTRVPPDVFDRFRQTWMEELVQTLSDESILPGHYPLIESNIPVLPPFRVDSARKAFRVDTHPPKVRWHFKSKYTRESISPSAISILDDIDDHEVARIEIITPAIKASPFAFHSFIKRVTDSIYKGVHQVVLDILPPGSLDPQGIHGAIWAAFTDEPQAHSEQLTLLSYSSGMDIMAYIEPMTVGSSLASMPLFLEADRYIEVPLEKTYDAWYRSVPEEWRKILDS